MQHLRILLLASALFATISANRVIHLDSDTFDAIVDGTRNVFLKFEAEWCGPCKRVAPIMDQVARESFPDIDGETILAAIDADKEREIGDRFEIEGFPTMKLFLKGRPHEAAINFSGERSPQNIANFINHHVAQNNLRLNDTEAANITPQFPLSKILQEIAKVGPKPHQVQQIKSNSYQDFHSGAFEKSNTDPSLKQHKQKKSKTRKDKSKSKKTAMAPFEIRDVNAQEAQEIIRNAGSKPVIMVFYSPNCPHCKEFMPECERTANARQNDAIFIRINGDANVNYRDSFKLRYYPSVIGYFANSNGQRQELYTGSRGTQEFNNFISMLQ